MQTLSWHYNRVRQCGV